MLLTRQCRWIPGWAVVLATAFGAPAFAGVANKAKVYVFPFQGIQKGVPKEILSQTSDLLRNEIKHNDEIQLQSGPIFIPEAVATEVVPLSDKDLKLAGQLYAQGEISYQELELPRAIALFQSALEKYEKSQAQLTDFEPVIDTLLMLSVCYYRTDKPDEGAKMLVKVVRLRPEIKLDPAKYPPVFLNTLEGVRTKLLRKTRGEVEVMANTDGAQVFWNGALVGQAPILLKDLVPGEHFLRVQKEGLQSYAAKVAVEPTKKVSVAAALGGVKKMSGPLGAIAEALRSNLVESATIDQAVAQGNEIGAEVLLIGGVAKVGNVFKVGSFLVQTKDKLVCSLPLVEFDPDMLGASVEVFNLIGEVVKNTKSCAQTLRAPFPVVKTLQAQTAQVKVAVVGPAVPPAHSPAMPATASPAAPRATGPARPAEPTQPAQPVANAPARPTPPPQKPKGPVVNAEGMATLSQAEPRSEPLVAAQVPIAEQGNVLRPPRDEDIQEQARDRWYNTWWVWTLVGVAVAGGTSAGLYFAGVFEPQISSGTVTVHW